MLLLLEYRYRCLKLPLHNCLVVGSLCSMKVASTGQKGSVPVDETPTESLSVKSNISKSTVCPGSTVMVNVHSIVPKNLDSSVLLDI